MYDKVCWYLVNAIDATLESYSTFEITPVLTPGMVCNELLSSHSSFKLWICSSTSGCNIKEGHDQQKNNIYSFASQMKTNIWMLIKSLWYTLLSCFYTVGPNSSKNLKDITSSYISPWAWFSTAQLQTILGPEFSARLANRRWQNVCSDVAF